MAPAGADPTIAQINASGPEIRADSKAAVQPSAAKDAAAPDFQLGYRRWLDGLRGWAILLVLAFHFGLVQGGSLGVDIFFVLSGFLITTLLAEEWQRRGSISLRDFYIRRALRLLPAFATLLLVCGIASLWFMSAHEGSALRQEMVIAACYVSNWGALHRTSMPTLGHTWSLSVEEQFYLLWPLLLCVMLWFKLSRHRILFLVCLGIFSSATLRIVLYSMHRTPGPDKAANIMRLYTGLDTRADCLLVGCVVGLLAVWGLLPRSRRFVFWTGAAAVLSAAALGYLVLYRALDHSQFYHGLFTGVAVMVAVIIVRLLSGPTRIGTIVLESTPLVWTGRISYGLYLFHIPIIRFLNPPGLGWRFPTETTLVAGLTLAAAVLSFFAIERPCLRLKDRLQRCSPRRSAAATVGSVRAEQSHAAQAKAA